MNIKEKAKELKATIPVIFLVLSDKETPLIAKVFAGITVGYALSPIDLIPDFIPILGYLDDIILLPLFISLTIKFIPKEVWKRNKEKVKELDNKKTKKWYYAIPIVIIWFIIIGIIIKQILR